MNKEYKIYNEEFIKKYGLIKVDESKIKRFKEEMYKNAQLYFKEMSMTFFKGVPM